MVLNVLAKLQAVEVVEQLVNVILPVLNILLFQEFDTHHLQEELVDQWMACQRDIVSLRGVSEGCSTLEWSFPSRSPFPLQTNIQILDSLAGGYDGYKLMMGTGTKEMKWLKDDMTCRQIQVPCRRISRLLIAWPKSRSI